MKRLVTSLVVLASVVMAYGAPEGVERHVFHGTVPEAAALLRPLDWVPGTNSLRLAISLPLHNTEALGGLLQRLYDPASPDYRHYLTPAQFTESFGPTEQEYQSVIVFAKAHGLDVVGTHDSRQLLDVRGKVSDIEEAFHVVLRSYQHPIEMRRFYAPEGEPWVDASLPIRDVAGLSDYTLVRRTQRAKPVGSRAGAAGGSSPIAGDYIGQDFRNAYAPGVTLQGAGQQVGLFEADGYYAADIANYVAYEDQSAVPLRNVYIDNFNGAPGALNGEVAVDIEMAIAMAPALSAVVVFECTNVVAGTNSGGTEIQYWLDTLDRMASSNQIKQFSSSWGYVTTNLAADPNTAFDAAFQQMAAQGQSFFQASGDGDAWATPIWVPGDSPYVTSVGGTSLLMNGLGVSYSGETVWNSGYGPPGWPITDNGYWGSGGGTSTVYPIPYWQQGISMSANAGSTTMRNIPDVALTATNVFFTAGNGQSGTYYGTSCSAPLWAGYAALINQQAANSNKPPVGFLNPAIYALGEGANYGLCFHDITIGSNASGASPSKFFAATGYDLCTGWGTPLGSNVINALAGVYQPSITTPPASQTDAAGGNASFTVTATGVTPLSYQWQFDGTNIAGATLANVTVANLTQASAGSYTVLITNQWGSLTSSVAVLTVGRATPTITWASPAAITYGTALTSTQLDATASVGGTFSYTPANGIVLNAGTAALSVTFIPTDTADYSNATKTVSLVVSPALLTVTANARSKTYGTAVAFGSGSAQFTPNGLQNGDTIGSVTLAVNNNGGVATAPVSGSPYTITPSAATGGSFAAGNYAITYATGNLTVSQAPLTITANAQSKMYGTSLSFGSGSAQFTPSGLQNGETVGSVTLAVSGSGGAGTAPVSGSPYTITPTGATGGTFATGNYTITYATGSLTVSKAPLTITANPQSKIYGQTLSFGSGSAQFTPGGLQNGETVGSVTLAVSGSGGAAAALVSGSPYTITPSGATGGTFTAGNYAISYFAANLTVSQAPLTIMANPQSKIYGQTLSFGGGSTQFAPSGLQNGESVGSVTLAVNNNGGAAAAPVSGSPYTITPSTATGGTFTAGNYSISYAGANLTVSQAPLTITANPQSKIYGQTLSFGSGSTQFTPSGLQNGESIGSVTLVVGGNGGAATASVSGSPYMITPSAVTGGTFTPGNYGISYVAGNLTVTQAPLTITANPQSKVYGQTLSFGSGSAQFSPSGLQNGETVGSVALAVNNNGGAATALVSGSPYTITPSAATGGTFAAANYAISYANGGLTITQAPLTITANPQSKVYGQTMNFGAGSAQFTPSGLQNGETVGSVTLAVNNNGGAGTASVSGSSYTITPSGATGGTFTVGNYAVAYANGNLTITQAPLTITANPQAKAYGQTLSFGSGSAQFTPVGLQNGETVGAVTLVVNNNGGAATAPVSGSPYTITPSAAIGGTFAAGNYAITYAAANLTVNGAALTVTANPQSKVYGQTLVFGSGSAQFTSSLLQNGETIGSVTLAVNNNGGAATAAVSGSPYTITPGAAIGGSFTPGNYTITYASASLTVSTAPLTITANPQSKIYGQTLAFGGGSTLFGSSGLQNGETIGSVTLAVNNNGGAATAPVSGSPYTITPSGAMGGTFVAGNYAITYAAGNLTVSAAALTVKASPQSKTYGQTLAFGGGSTIFTSSGLQNGETIGTVTLAVNNNGGAATAPVSGSPYTITPSAAAGGSFTAGNYTITYTTGNLTVNGAALAITANPQSKMYGQTVAFGGGSALFGSSGLQNGETIGTVTLAVNNNGGAATAPVSGSPYIITPSAAAGGSFTAGNYAITFVTGNLTVNAAPLIVTASPQSKSYGQTVVFGSGSTQFTSSGLQNSETVGSVTLSVSGSGGAATAPVSGSPYIITPSAATAGTFTAGNYAITYATGTLTVTEAGLIITWANPAAITYGTALTSGQLDATANVAGSFAYAPTNGSVLNSGANTLSVLFTPTDTVDYSNANATVSLTVSKAPLTVTAANASRTYGQTNPVLTGQITGVVNGDNITATYSTTATTSSPLNTYPIVPSLVDPNSRQTNYTVTAVNGALIVGQATPTLTWTNPASIVYGAALTTGQLNATASVPGSFAYTPPIGSTLNAGTNTLSVVFTPTDAVDFASLNGTVTLVVSSASLTFAAASFSRAYDTANPTFTGTITGLANSDNITATYSCGATLTSQVGTYPIVPIPVDPNSRLTNYIVTVVDGILLVGHPTESYTWNPPAPITYGTALGPAQLNATVNVPGSYAYTPNNGAVLNTGTNTLSVIFTPTDQVNYTGVTNNVNLVVLPAPLTIAGSSTNRLYGQANPALTGTLTGLVNGDTVTAAFTCSAIPTSAVGTYAITLGAVAGTDLTNYTITYNNGTLTVNPVALTITAIPQSKTYGQTLAFGAGSTKFISSLLQNGETIGTVTLGVSGNGGAAAGPVSGSPYTITPSVAAGGTFTAGNYAITYVTGSLTVSPAPVTITANSQSKIYGQTMVFGGGSAQFTSSPLQNGETIGTVTLTAGGNGGAATAPVSGSPYTITPSGATGGTFIAGNYAITYATSSLTVSAAPLTVTASPQTKTYGQTLAFGGGSALFGSSGLQNGETIGTVTLTVNNNGGAAAAPASGPPYTITPSGATGGTFVAGNYTITYATGNLTVNAVSVVVTASPQTKTYGQTLAFGGGSTIFTSSGLQNGETIGAVTLAVNNNGGAATAPVSGSPYTITPSGATGGTFAPGNYTITYAAGNLTVNGAALTITANPQSKMYGQSIGLGAGSTLFASSGLQNGETIGTVTLSVNNNGGAGTAPVSGSPYTITPSAAAAGNFAPGNYVITYVAANLTVNAAPLIITASPQSKSYGQTVLFGSGSTFFSTSGLQNSETIGTVTLSVSGNGGAATAPVSGSPYIITPSAATGGTFTAGNYAITYATGTLTVSEAGLIVTWANPASIIYGAALAPNQLNATANRPGSFAYTPTNGSVLNSGPNTLSVLFTPTDTVDYSNATETVTLVVLPAPLAVTAASFSRAFNTPNPAFTGTITGLTNGDDITANYSCSAVTSSPDGTYHIVPSVVDPDSRLTNYTVSVVNGTLTVGLATPTVTWPNPAPIIYGAALTSKQLDASASVPGNYTYTPTNGGVLNAGTNTLSVFFAPTDTTDYSSATDTANLVVSPATLTVTAASLSRPFNTANPVFTGTITGLANGDNITATYTCSAIAGSPVGTYLIVPSLVDPNNRLTNYLVNLVNGALTVNGATPAMTWNSPAAIIYGIPLSSSQLNATVNVPGSFSYVPASGTTLNAGANALSVIFTPTDTVDYSDVSKTVNLIVSPASLTVTASSFGRDYDETNPVFTGTITGLTNGDDITATYSSSATITSPVGTYQIVPSLVDPNDRQTNYTVSLVNGTLTVGQATSVLTWTNPASIIYGAALTPTQLNATVNVSGALTYTPTNGSVLNVGTNSLSVVFTPTDTANYGSVTAQASLVVSPASLTVTAASFSRPFDTANPAYTGTIVGLTNGDAITATYSCSATINSPVGTYAIVPTLVDPNNRLTNYVANVVNGILVVGHPPQTITWNAPDAITYGTPLSSMQLDAVVNIPGNYSYTPTNGTVLNVGVTSLSVVFTPTDAVDYSNITKTVNLLVSPASLTVTASSVVRDYDETNPVLTGTITGLTNGDNITATYSSSATITSPVGSYHIVPSLVDPNGRQTNYTVSLINGTLTVGPATPTLTWTNPASITYGTALDTNQLNATASVPGGFAYTPTNGSVLNAGTNTLSVIFTPTDTLDYQSVAATESVIVSPALLTVTASNFSRAYESPNPVFMGAITGLTNGDDISATYSSIATIGSPVGTYAIVPALVDPGDQQTNYVVTLIDGILVVGHPTELITWSNPAPVSYGTPLTPLQLDATVNVPGAYAYEPTNGAVLNTGTNTLSVIFTPTDSVDFSNVVDTATLVVLPVSLTVTASNFTRQFGAANPDFTGTITGLTNGDDITATYSCSATSSSPSGTYAIVPALADLDKEQTNYTVSLNNGTLTITGSPSIQVKAAKQSGNLFIITWSATPSQSYQIQYTTKLSRTGWANLGSPVAATNSTASASDPITNSEMFYRIVLLP